MFRDDIFGDSPSGVRKQVSMLDDFLSYLVEFLHIAFFLPSLCESLVV